MKSVTTKQLTSNNNINQSNKEIKKLLNQGKKYTFRYNNIKDIKNPSVQTRRNPRYFNVKNNNLKRKIKSSSRAKNKKNNNQYIFFNNINNLNIYNVNTNKIVCNDANGKSTVSKRGRNLSAPTSKNEKQNYYHKNKKNIIKLIQMKNKLDGNIINKDNYNDKMHAIKSFSNKKNNIITKEDENSKIKVNLNKTNLAEEENVNDIKIYKFNSTLNNYYKNINNKKKLNKLHKLNHSEHVLSDFRNNIENIKNIKENISLLKEQLKDDKKIIKGNHNNNNKGNNKKNNHTINITKQISKNKTGKNIIYKIKKKKNNNSNNCDINNNNENVISNFHSYNKNVLNQINEKKNTNKTKNSYNNNNLSITSNDTTPNKNIINSTIINSQNNSSNNKTLFSTSTNMTNNEFGKKLNLSSIYGSKNDKEEKGINDIKENNIINNINNNRIYKLGKNKTMKYENEKINNKNEEININNKINKINKNNNNKNTYKNKRNLIENNNRNYLYKTSNSLTFQNQYNSFNNPKINKKDKDKDTKDIQNQDKNKKNNKTIFNNKNNDQTNLFPRNTVNYINKNKNNNSLSLRYNTINNDKNNCQKSKKNHRSNISYDGTHNKKKKIISKIKMFHNSKGMETNHSQNTDINLIKRKQSNSQIANEKNNSSMNDNNENMCTPKNKVKKYLTRLDFNYKSISIYDIGIITKAGEATFGETKVNQDNYFNYQLSDGLRFIGVCDGHGDYGHCVSKFLRNYLPLELEKDLKKLYRDEGGIVNLLQKEMSFNCYREKTENNSNNNSASQNNDNYVLDKIRKIFEISFTRTDKNLSEFCGYLANLKTCDNVYDVEYSGSTCVSILLKDNNMNKIYIANVGDSRAIVVKETKSKYWSCWTFKQLSRDHKPNEPDEAQRILDCDGEIEKIEDDDGNWTGPLRVWVKGSDGPGLAMTRSFGDEIGASVGVISTPEVGEYTIKEEDRAIIIASDGLWEYMSNKEVTEIIEKLIVKKDANIIVNQLYKESVNKWRINDQGIDDITIICILLKNN